jgi:hypothetical protein
MVRIPVVADSDLVKELMASIQSECTCAAYGVAITGLPVVPATADGPTRAQVEKLKPTVYLCAACARQLGSYFTHPNLTAGAGQ